MNLFDQEFLSALWVLSFLINNFQATVLDFCKLATPKLKGDLKVLAANLNSKCGTSTTPSLEVSEVPESGHRKGKVRPPNFLNNSQHSLWQALQCFRPVSHTQHYLCFFVGGNKGSVLCIVGCWATLLASTH